MAPRSNWRNDGRAKIDRVTIDLDNTRLVAKLTAELRRSPREFTLCICPYRTALGTPTALWASRTSLQCSAPIGS